MKPSPQERRVWIAEHDPLPIVARGAVGYDPCGRYAETYWLGIIGPSSLWLLRRLVRALRVAPVSGTYVPLGALARELGLGYTVAPSSPLIASLERLVAFRLAAITSDVYEVSVAVPELDHRQLKRIPEHLAVLHTRLVASEQMS